MQLVGSYWVEINHNRKYHFVFLIDQDAHGILYTDYIRNVYIDIFNYLVDLYENILSWWNPFNQLTNW